MSKIFLACAFCISLVLLPWWATALCAVLFLAEGGNILFVILGGCVLDQLFGAPVAALGGFSYLYASLFIVLGGAALYLRSMLFE